MVELLTFLWLFNPSQQAVSTLSAQIPLAEFRIAGVPVARHLHGEVHRQPEQAER